ncbi:L-type lectin-domain containing receptor kinase S.1 [Nymphaea colorata]|uniref:non-specific serine/threonine protein kinase n=1 Tax=Nymphaea colorata TaxID=210225 RepID=A0A5K1B481_9MAGN|nr:L-type lectin-domain containing receptor kinase S.1 [Nymphaea colorata]
MPLLVFYFLLNFAQFLQPSSSLDFRFNSFNTTDLFLVGDARVESNGVVRLTNATNQFSIGRAFFPSPLPMITATNSSGNNTMNGRARVTSFSTTFIFSILPIIPSSPGFGLAFVISASTAPPGALPGQYFGLFNNTAERMVGPLVAIEFDTGRNPEFGETDGNHVGVNLNNIVPVLSEPAGYWDANASVTRQIDMRSGKNIQAWVEFDGINSVINVTIAPAGQQKPQRPLLSYKNANLSAFFVEKMFVGFSASIVTWVEAQRILAWSFSSNGTARPLDTSNLPVFLPESVSRNSSTPLIAGVVCASLVVLLVSVSVGYWIWLKRRNKEEEIEDWELEYWPHRISYEDLDTATDGFANKNLLGSGGFGSVYRGTLPNNNIEVAVKCISNNSKQGLREFIAEISSMGRLQHRNLVQMRGWCRRGNELMLVYDYMPNGSLDKRIFDNPSQLLGWAGRRRVLNDVAEGLLYLHDGWEECVLHRDIKSSNILLDADMRGRLGDFGLARLYEHGQAPRTTRVVGTLGYLAPELARITAPTKSCDVFSFGIVMLEVACGRRPIEEEPILIDWVRELYTAGRVLEAADKRIAGEYDPDDVETVLKLGLACCHPEPDQRPSIKQVVSVLLGS